MAVFKGDLKLAFNGMRPGRPSASGALRLPPGQVPEHREWGHLELFEHGSRLLHRPSEVVAPSLPGMPPPFDPDAGDFVLDPAPPVKELPRPFHRLRDPLARLFILRPLHCDPGLRLSPCPGGLAAGRHRAPGEPLKKVSAGLE